MDYSREKLIEICERAIVPHEAWHDRDSYSAQNGVGQLWAMLKANAPFAVQTTGTNCVTDERTIWVRITAEGFASFDWGGGPENEVYYLPTEKRLTETAGRDWY